VLGKILGDAFRTIIRKKLSNKDKKDQKPNKETRNALLNSISETCPTSKRKRDISFALIPSLSIGMDSSDISLLQWTSMEKQDTMYTSKSSKNGEDFLLRLLFLLNNQLPRVGHDNGTEFEKHFRIACEKLKIEQYYSRVRTPTDNPNNERFNRTIEEEFIDLGNWSSDPNVFNTRLTEWLIEYNFVRSHEALHYRTPMEVSKVLPMYSFCTLP
jgi:IS30 family transposase